MNSQLPDRFETRAGRALSQALDAGDRARFEQLALHTVTEGSTTAQEEQDLAETIRAAALFKESMAESKAGDAVRGKQLLDELAATCSRKTVITVVAAATLQTGLNDGWLPAESHDRLTGWTVELDTGEEIRAMVASIERR
jgi:hypothetical protein